MNNQFHIVVYSHDAYGLGNIRRMLAVCEALLQAEPCLSILLLSGSPVVHRLSLPAERFDYVKLPALTRVKAENYEVRSLGMPLADTLSLRARMIRAVLETVRPDLVLVDKKPGGIEGELLPAINGATEDVRWVLVLRDILDAPDVTIKTWKEKGYFDLVARHYRQVFVLGTPDVFDMRREYRIPEPAASKWAYCGYLRREPTAPPPSRDDGTPTVLVTPGGGEDGFQLLKTYLKGLSLMPSARWRTHIVTGPELDEPRRKKLRDLAIRLPHVVTMETFSPDIPALMAGADLVVAMGGYNTLCEIVSQCKRAVIVPRRHPTQEQWVRAHRFARRGLIHCLDPEEASPARLMEQVAAVLTGTVSPMVVKPLDLNGLQRLTAGILSLIHDGSTVRRVRFRSR